jgi:signal transduction histidine kinase
VSVRRADGDVAIMVINDDGTGFQGGAENKRHGLGLVRRLVEQVRGSASLDSSHGTVWTISIPIEHMPLPVVLGRRDATGDGRDDRTRHAPAEIVQS